MIVIGHPHVTWLAYQIGQENMVYHALDYPETFARSMEAVYQAAAKSWDRVPDHLALAAGTSTTLRGELGNVLRHYNKLSGGAFLVAAADLLGSTSINAVAEDFSAGYYNAQTNPDSRLMSTGGICEDAMMGIMSGLSTYGHHIGAGSSYGAFIAPLGHIPAHK